MIDGKNTKGTNRYFQEYVFYKAVEAAQEHLGSVIVVSEAKRLREMVDAELTREGKPIGGAKSADLGASIDTVFGREVAGYTPLFTDGTRVRSLVGGFNTLLGSGSETAGPAGPRVPVSPYDPRWSLRGTVKLAGSDMLYITEDDVEQYGMGNMANFTEYQGNELMLKTVDSDGKVSEAGPSNSYDDMSGMTALMEYMPADAWRDAKRWVEQGARTGGRIDPAKFMTPKALARTLAVLGELSDQGVKFKVLPDMKPGQLKASIEGTRLSVRVADSRENENFVGHRIYDDGAQIYFTTVGAPRGVVLGWDDPSREGFHNNAVVTPTPDMCVDILRYAQGLPVARRDNPEKSLGEVDDYRDNRGNPIQASYHTADTSTFVYANVNSRGTRTPLPGAKMSIHRDSKNRSNRFKRRSAEGSSVYLQDAVHSARTNLVDALDVDNLVDLYNSNEEAALAGELFPDFSGDTEVASIQRAYWDVLRGQQTTLLRPGSTAEQYEDLVGAIGQEILTEEEFNKRHDYLAESVVYTGSPEDKVRAHAAEVPDGMIGTYEAYPQMNAEGVEELKRFNPIRVAKYMDSEHGLFRNNDDMVWAMKMDEIDVDELLGSSVYANSVKNAMIEFDSSSAMAYADHSDPFVRRMGALVEDTIRRNGAVPSSIAIDDQGVISWTAERYGREGDTREISGEVGQIFGYGEKGTVTTNFGSGDNYMFVPGYEARIAAQKPGETKSVEERTVLRGYEQIMSDQIQYQVSNDVSSKLARETSQVGGPISLNNVYRRVYDVRHDVNFLELSREEGMETSLRDAVLATEARRVRYDNDIRDGSTANAEYRASRGLAGDPANDNFGDAWTLTGGRNMAIMGGESSLGFYDPVMTSGSTNQGITRYLVESAEVGEDGRIVQGELDDSTPLAKHEVAEFMKFDPVDRQQMTYANLLKARQVTPPTGVAMRPLGGWNFDDGFVISKDFADGHQLRGADGELRPLQVGDKLSDLHGNKGVISLVVDREMDAADAQAEGIAEAVGVFANNGDLDVVISPFSAVSRFNGGSARELMQKTGRLYDHDETEYDGGIGMARLIVTDHAADAKTNIYGEAELAQGKGRRASAQLAWALGSHGADAVMAEFYGGNTSAVANFREMLVTMGMDMAPDGSLVEGRWDPASEGIYDSQMSERRILEQPEIPYTGNMGLNINRVRTDFGKLIGDKGGDLELPFQLNFPQATADEGVRGIPQAANGQYLLPVLSAHLRSGQDMEDGTSTSHEYTNRYMSIQEQAMRFRHAEARLQDPDLKPKNRLTLEQYRSEAQSKAQGHFDAITTDLKERHFSGKRNAFKESLMSSRLPHSATAVWTADPRLDVDEVAMSSGMAEQLGLKAGDYSLIWRDPVLRDSGVRYMRVAINDNLTGVAINPAMDGPFDGDFDGDAVAVVRLTSREAHAQAMELLTVEANLLDLGTIQPSVDSVTGELDLDPETGLPLPGDSPHPLNIQNSLDVSVAQHVNPVLAEDFARITQAANDNYYDFSEGELTRAQFLTKNRELVSDLSTYYRRAFNEPGIAAQATLRFDEPGKHVDSVRAACIETGAKGSEEKLGSYQRYAGIDATTMELGDKSLASRAEAEGVWFALQAKAFGTGVAGAYSQRGVKMGRNEALSEVLELTYPVTQSMLQAKHDPAEARHKYEMLMGPARDLWKGRQLRRGDSGWETVRDEKGAEVQASLDDWRRTFHDFYTAKDGLNVKINPAHIVKVAEVLSQDGVMLDMEDTVALARAGKDDLGSLMDRQAYGGTFEDLVNASRAGKNIFEGNQNGHFAPYSIRRNQMEKSHAERGLIMEPSYVEIGDMSATKDGPVKGQNRRIAEARPVRAPKRKMPQEVVPNATAPEVLDAEAEHLAKVSSMPGYDPSLG